MVVDEDWSVDGPVRRGPRGPRAGAQSVDALLGNARTASSLMSHDDPSMLLLRRDIQNHARTRRKSVTMSAMPDDERAELEDCWKALEIGGSLDVKQLIKAADVVLGAGAYTERNLRRAFGVLDVTHSGQVDWITFRAFMTANWNAGRNADEMNALWTENRKRDDDMLLVDGSMRLVDLIKAYRRRTLVERALKDAQGQLREMQHKRDNGLDDTGTGTDDEGSTPPPAASQPASQLHAPASGPRPRRRSISYDPEDVASRLPVASAFGGPAASKRPQAQSEKQSAPGGAAPSRLRRAQAELLAAAAAEVDASALRELTLADHPEEDDSARPLTSTTSDNGSRLLPHISSSSSPTSPVDPLSASHVSRFSRPLGSSFKPATPPMSPTGNGCGGALDLPGGRSHTQPQQPSTPQGTFIRAGRAGSKIDDRDNSESIDHHRSVGQRSAEQLQQPSTPISVQQAHEASNEPRHPGQSHGQSNTDKRGTYFKPAPKKLDSMGHSGLLAPIKQDLSAGFGRLAKFFWKSAPESHGPAVVEHRNRLPRI